jgi:hypothetical protein
MEITRIVGNQAWKSFTGKYIMNKKIVIRKCVDIHPYKDGPVFNCAETIFMDECDKNFVYYWLNEKTFPAIEKVYLLSHPCDPQVFRRFSQSPKTIIYLSDDFGQYKERWAKKQDNIIVLSHVTIKQYLQKHDVQAIITSE